MNAWSSEQTRLLSVLGYTLYRRSANEPANAASAAIAEMEPAGAVPVDRTGDPLWRALCRAANDAALEALGIDLATLRRRPDEKRALWPRLRVLRRAASTTGGPAMASAAEAPNAGNTRRSR